jgi:hypothetical protein
MQLSHLQNINGSSLSNNSCVLLHKYVCFVVLWNLDRTCTCSSISKNVLSLDRPCTCNSTSWYCWRLDCPCTCSLRSKTNHVSSSSYGNKAVEEDALGRQK